MATPYLLCGLLIKCGEKKKYISSLSRFLFHLKDFCPMERTLAYFFYYNKQKSTQISMRIEYYILFLYFSFHIYIFHNWIYRINPIWSIYNIIIYNYYIFRFFICPQFYSMLCCKCRVRIFTIFPRIKKKIGNYNQKTGWHISEIDNLIKYFPNFPNHLRMDFEKWFCSSHPVKNLL